MTGRRRLTVYVREGCHLCEDLLRELAGLRDELAFEYGLVDIDRDAELRLRYNEWVPVVAYGEQVLSRHFLDSAAVREALAHG